MNRIFTLLTIFFIANILSINAQNLDVEWVTPVPGSGGMILTSSTTLDTDGNIYAVGSFLDSIEVNTINGKIVLKGLTANKQCMFITKLNTAGQVEWIKSIGGKESIGIAIAGDVYNHYYSSVVNDQKGGLYITGTFKDTVDFDPGTGEQKLSTGSYKGGSFPGQPAPTLFYENTFLLKLDTAGDFVWVKQFYGNTNAGTAIAIDLNESTLAVTGYFQDTTDFNNRTGTNKLISTNRKKDVFVVKYDTDGNFKWVKQMGGGGVSSTGNEGVSIHIDNKGNILTTGIFSDSADFDPGAGKAYLISTAKPGVNVFVSKLTTEGSFVWAKAMGSVSNGNSGRGSAITTDSEGNVLTTGYFQGTGNFDPTNNTTVTGSPGGLSMFISKLDAGGNFVWAKALDRPVGKVGVEQGKSIVTDENGNVFIAGFFTGDIYMDPDMSNISREVFSANTNSDAFLLKLDKSGNYAWGKLIKSSLISRSMNVQVQPDRTVYLSGYFFGSTKFSDKITLSALSGTTSGDGFIVKYYCTDTSFTDMDLTMCADSFELNGFKYTESGSYNQLLTNNLGCDSTLQLTLTLHPLPQARIAVEEFSLSTTEAFSSYQWMLDGEIIPGATDRTYILLENGAYQVIVTNEYGCMDTSDVYVVNNLSINGYNTEAIKIFPNPAYRMIYIRSPYPVNVSLTGIDGKEYYYGDNKHPIPVNRLPAGIYFLKIYTGTDQLVKVEKVIVDFREQ